VNQPQEQHAQQIGPERLPETIAYGPAGKGLHPTQRHEKVDCSVVAAVQGGHVNARIG
jgi:hypothetical protein